MQQAAKKGLVWTSQNIPQYVQNPRKCLDDVAGDSDAPNKMTFSLSDAMDREDVVGYLQSLAAK